MAETAPKLGPWERRNVCRSTMERIGATVTEAEVNAELRRLRQVPISARTFLINYREMFGREAPDAQLLKPKPKDWPPPDLPPLRSNDPPKEHPADRLPSPLTVNGNDPPTVRETLDSFPAAEPLARGEQRADQLEGFIKFAATVSLIGGVGRARHYLDLLDRLGRVP